MDEYYLETSYVTKVVWNLIIGILSYLYDSSNELVRLVLFRNSPLYVLFLLSLLAFGHLRFVPYISDFFHFCYYASIWRFSLSSVSNK